MIRVAVVGYGYWGPNVCRNVREVEGLELGVICDRDQDRLELAHRRYPDVRCTRDADTVTADSDVDAVVVATPLASHFPIAAAALEAGKHVLVEKPLAATSWQAEALEQMAEERGRVLMVDHTFVYTGAVRELERIVAAGDLGRILYYDSVRINLGLIQPDCDVIWDLAPHDLSILLDLVGGMPWGVLAVGSDPLGVGKTTCAHLTLDFPFGLATIHVNWLSPVKVRRTIVGGSDRSVIYDDVEPTEKIRVYERGVGIDDLTRAVDYRTGSICAPKLEFAEALSIELDHFAACIRTGGKPITGGRQGADVVRILEAATLSLDRCERVEL